MGRQQVEVEHGFVVCGWDKPFGTYFAQFYEPGDDVNDPPVKAFGYHPTEVNPAERTEHYGAYPITTLRTAQNILLRWGLSDGERLRLANALTVDRRL